MADARLADMGPRELAAAAIMAAGEEALQICNEPEWVKRQRMGDPTITGDLLQRGCVRVGMDAAQIRAVQELLAADAPLKQLLAGTLAASAANAGAAAASDGRRRFWIGVLVTVLLAGLLCGAGLLLLEHLQPDLEHGGHHDAGGGTGAP
jgi:hypothetical protein